MRAVIWIRMNDVPEPAGPPAAIKSDEEARQSDRAESNGGALEHSAREALQHRKKWLDGQNEAFEAAVNEAPLDQSLEILIRTAIAQLGGKARGAFYLANDEGTELRHLVGMGEAYARDVDGFRIGVDSLACGLAFDTNAPVITPDVRQDPRWEPWLWLAEKHNYRACWSFPVGTSPGKLVGTFALYFEEPRSPMPGELDLADSLVGTASIIISQHQNHSRLRESEQRLRLVLEGIGEAFYVLDRDLRFVFASTSALALWGKKEAEVIGRTFLDAFPGASGSEAYLAQKRVAESREPTHIETISPILNRWIEADISPAPDGGLSVALRDIDARKRAELALRDSERHAQTLLAELQHRVRNTLAVVRSIVRRTAERSSSVDELLSHFEGRLNAFSRVQSAVTRTPGSGVNIRAIVEDELLAVAAREGQHLGIDGPDLFLKPRVAESISLAIHELATNAVKYGALSERNGGVRVTWQRLDHAEPELLRLEWLESGLRAEPKPYHEGFGHEMLLRTLPYDLGGETNIEFTADGMRFTMVVPLGPDVLTE